MTNIYMMDLKSSSGILMFVVVSVVCVYYMNQWSGENYQNEIDKIAREKDIQKDKYPYQDVSQESVAENKKDWEDTYKIPNKLADDYTKNNPSSLLPSDSASNEWARANPTGAGSLELKNMLSAGTHLGVNTQGSSLKNANYQLRSEPPNPIIPVSVFRNSTITPDIFRKELEIGECK